MKVILFIIISSLLVLALQAQNQHAFIGAKSCQLCHMGQAKHNVYETWLRNPHARAYQTLSTDRAKKLSFEQLGKTIPPFEDPECLKCHVTGFGVETQLAMTLDKSEGVACESCHGAGKDYSEMFLMQKREKAIAYGLMAQPSKTCEGCHNEQSPTYKPFEFQKFWAKIKHGQSSLNTMDTNSNIPILKISETQSTDSRNPETYPLPQVDPLPQADPPPSASDTGK